MSSRSDPREWVSGAEAARRLGCDSKQVPRLAAKRLLTVRRLPGCAPRYLLCDVDRLAAAATLHANAQPEDV